MTNTKRWMTVITTSNVLAWGIVAFFLVSGFTQTARGRFTELDVERLNIIGDTGKPVLVLSNRRLIHGPSMNGKTYPRELADGRELLSGMIFFKIKVMKSAALSTTE